MHTCSSGRGTVGRSLCKVSLHSAWDISSTIWFSCTAMRVKQEQKSEGRLSTTCWFSSFKDIWIIESSTNAKIVIFPSSVAWSWKKKQKTKNAVSFLKITGLEKKIGNPSTRQIYTNIEIQSTLHALSPVRHLKTYIREFNHRPRGLKGELMASRIQGPKMIHKAALRHCGVTASMHQQLPKKPPAWKRNGVF